jgi:DsbC/DsbD-like thiol-disulfide interchange protein
MFDSNLFKYILVLFLTQHLSLSAQTEVDWIGNFDVQNKRILLTASIPDGWHIYSQYIAPEVGPVPTSFEMQPSKGIKCLATVSQPTPIQQYDDAFGALLDYFEGEVQFGQQLKIKKSGTVQCTISYMMCDKTMCLPPTEKQLLITINN